MCLVWKGGAALPSYTLPCLLQRPASTPMTPYPESCAGLEIDDAVVQQRRLDGFWEPVNVFLGSEVVRPLGNRHLRVGWAGTVDKRRRSEQTRVAKTETHTRALYANAHACVHKLAPLLLPKLTLYWGNSVVHSPETWMVISVSCWSM